MEVAPGIDVQRDVLDLMEFTPKIPPEGVKFMSPEIFREEWFGLSGILDGKEG